MNYTFTQDRDVQVLSVKTLLYEYENRRILQEIEDKIASGKNQFVVDLVHLQYVNSVGLSFLIAALTKSRNAGGEVIIVNILEKVSELLTTTKLKSIFTIGNSIEEGIELLQTK